MTCLSPETNFLLRAIHIPDFHEQFTKEIAAIMSILTYTLHYSCTGQFFSQSQ